MIEVFTTTHRQSVDDQTRAMFFAEEIAVSEDAPAIDKLVAFLGRQPWSPSEPRADQLESGQYLVKTPGSESIRLPGQQTLSWQGPASVPSSAIRYRFSP